MLLAAPAASIAAADVCPDISVSFAAGQGAAYAEYSAYLADDPEEQQQGLMHVPALPADQAMLFDFGEETRVGFWMKDTLIPLDMVFMDGTGHVLAVHENARPGDETTIPSPAGTRFVLEINGGQARMNGIASGHAITVAPLIETCLKGLL